MNDSQLTGTLNALTLMKNQDKDSIICLQEAKAHILELSGYFSQSLLLLGDQI